MHQLMRVNVKTGEITTSPYPKENALLQGRALISQILHSEVEPTCHPLGPGNKLIIAPGVLGGTTISCVNRLSVGAKSPLTGGIKESNAGGHLAYKLARLNLSGVVVEDIPNDAKDDKENDLKVLYISRDEARLDHVGNLKEKGVYQTAEILHEKYGESVGIAAIGPAGERSYQNSGIGTTDREGRPSRYAARGGLGSVMGSKGLKAVVIDDSEANGPDLADSDKIKELQKQVAKTIANNEKVAETYTKYGTANLVKVINSLNALPTRNFSTGKFEGADNISGQTLRQLITERSGDPEHACMPGCVIRCSNVFPGKDGNELVSPVEYETIGLLGSNCGINDMDTIGKLNYLCNDLGLDTIETGGTIAICMEAGVIEFGDGQGAISLLEEVQKDSYLGKIIGAGGLNAGKILGVKRVPTCKGQIMAAYDPRAIKGLGVTYATSPMGADHTAGQTLRAPVEHTKKEGQVEASRTAQENNGIHDLLGTCFFLGGGIANDFELLAEIASAVKGGNYSGTDLRQEARAMILREKQFNEKAGLNAADDMLPEFFYREENPAAGTVFDVPHEELIQVHNFE